MLFAFGSNGCGQLGLGHNDDISYPALVLLNKDWPIKHIATGGNHTTVLFQDGEAHSYGNNDVGQSELIAQVPSRLQRPSDGSATIESENVTVAQVSATWSTTTYLRTDGSFLVTGEGTSGELGLGSKQTNVPSPSPLARFLPRDVGVVHIASCMAHSVAITSEGEVWGWGNGRKGQLGEPAEVVWEPRKFDSVPFPVVRAVCGKDFTCVIGSSSTGEVAIYGPNRNDRFGVQKDPPRAVPGWKSIVASWGSVYILKDDGSIVAWGRNDHGQLPPANLPPIEAIAAGSEHCLALTKAGKVLAWGWGEHGNCGLPTDGHGDVKEGWNEIAVDDEVTGLYAGCATSFIVTSNKQSPDER